MYQVFEFTASGVVEITEKKGYYRPHIKDSEEKSHFRLDIGLLIMTILAYILNIGAHVIKKTFAKNSSLFKGDKNKIKEGDNSTKASVEIHYCDPCDCLLHRFP